MKIALFLTSCWLSLVALFLPAEKAVLSGKITGSEGKPLVGSSVKALKNKAIVKTAFTDTDGQYRLELEPGTYDVECALRGHVAQRILNVPVLEKQNNTLDFGLEDGGDLDEVIVRDYRIAVTAYGASGAGAAHRKELSAYADYTPATMSGERGAPAVKGDKIAAVPPHEATAPKPARPTPARALAKAAPGEPEGKDAGMKKKPAASYEEKSEIVGDKTIMPTAGGPSQPTPRAGLLTAGEWNDLHNWNRHWTDLLADGEIDQYQTMYGFFPQQRYALLLTNEQDFPVADAAVQLKAGSEILWETRTDNSGKAELWAGLFDKKTFPGLQVDVEVNGKRQEFGRLKPAKDGLNRFKIKAECSAPKNVDIVWAVDATGSMGDEIEYLKTELLDVIGRAKGRNPGLDFRMGTVFYRDQSDAYITKSSGLSPDISKTVEFIGKQYADGGGDYPEAVHSALEEAIFSQKWSDRAIARICFLVLDASPHQSPEVNASLQKSIREAARLGIRIVPVTASGIQKDTEFLMKFFGLATNGTYVFLTDHSGIGGKHLEPTTDEYKVELLNDLLVRLISEYTAIETCEGQSVIRFEDDPQQQQQNQAWQALYYPNPASTQFILELPFDVQSVVLYDSEGKAVRKLEKPQAGQNTVIVTDLSEGFYTIRILKDGRMQSGKLMVLRV